MRIEAGEWAPDLPLLALGISGALKVARNVIPRAVGYGPFPTFKSLNKGVLAARARGGVAALDHQGSAYNFSGDATKLYRTGPKQTAPEDVSRAGGYALGTKDGWNFVRFGDELFALTEHEVIQHFNILSGDLFADTTEAADPDNVTGTAPQAKFGGRVRDHLVVGNTYDSAEGEHPERIWWPAIFNPLFWPEPSTDLAIAAQSGFQDLQGDGGEVMGIIEGMEIGAVLQEHAIWRMDYVGGVDVFALFRVETERGSMIPGLAVEYGREFLYCNEDGWWRSNYTNSQPVGEEKINRFFLADLDQANIHRITAVSDPDLPLSYILYPGAGNVGGLPNKILVYHWIEDRFAIVDALELQILVRAVQPNLSIDDFPDTPNIDALTESLDERPTAFDALNMGAYDSTNELGEFSGDALEGTVETGALEASPGNVVMVNDVRPLIEGADCFIQLGGVMHLGGPLPIIPADTFGRRLRMDKNGDCGGRLQARYHFLRAIIPSGGFTAFAGWDLSHARVKAKR